MMLGVVLLRATDRQLRLFVAGRCRLAWQHPVDGRVADAVAVAERFADGLAGEQELEAASLAALGLFRLVRLSAAQFSPVTLDDHAKDAAGAAVYATSPPHKL